MVKSKLFSTLCVSLLLLSSTGALMSASTTSTSPYCFEEVIIHPYHLTQGCIVDITLSRTDSNIPYVSVSTAADKQGLYSVSKYVKKGTPNQVLDVRFQIKPEDLYEGITYFFIFTYNTILYSAKQGFIAAVKPIDDYVKEEYVITSDKQPTLEFNNFYYMVRGVIKNYEKYDFSTWDSLFLDEFYYRIDLEQVKFGYKSPAMKNKLPQTAYAVITIYDPDNYFEHITQGIEGRKRFTLYAFSDENGTVSLVNDYTFYVDPNTFITYSTQVEGTVPTKYIYLPKYMYKQGLTFKYNIHFYDIGFNEIELDYTFSRQIDKRLVGNCVDSKYCVIGEQSNDHFKGGDIYEVNK